MMIGPEQTVFLQLLVVAALLVAIMVLFLFIGMVMSMIGNRSHRDNKGED